MSPATNLAASLTEFPRFKDLPPELRIPIWRLISLPEPIDKATNKYQAVNIYPQCKGQSSHFSYTRNTESFHPWLVIHDHILHNRKTTKTPLPITTQINRESRAETFKYWAIELSPKPGLAPLCWLPSHHEIELYTCCFIEARRRLGGRDWDDMDVYERLDCTEFGDSRKFPQWIQYLKKQHPGVIEKIREINGVMDSGMGCVLLESYMTGHCARRAAQGLSSKTDEDHWTLCSNISEFSGLEKFTYRIEAYHENFRFKL